MWSRFVMSQVKHNSYFLTGVALGLWLSLAVIPLDDETAACAGVGAALPAAGDVPVTLDDFEPHREERPLGPAGAGLAAGRSVQRPRYYTTELGMRGTLMTGVLSSEGALKTQVAALNQTMARLQPALKFFITASAVSTVPGLANVVGFTDTREMLKPFHALKYLADNYLEEYDFFFLVSDGGFVHARRLEQLVARLSVSQDLYLGEPAAGSGSHYCDLDSGIILSNSVLRAVHAELDWCVRNSYSAHHHENVGRCVLHAAHTPCASVHQGAAYVSLRLDAGEAPPPAELADAVTAWPADDRAVRRLHAYAARLALERTRVEARRLRAAMWRLSARHPLGARNGTWPAGLRADPSLAPPAPDSRFDHARWTLFNATHAFMPDETGRATGALDAACALAVRSATAWARRRWPWAARVELAEGAWRWEPARALRYRLTLRLEGGGGATLRAVEAARALGAARLVPVRYVTESARVSLVLGSPLTPLHARDATAALRRYKQLHTQRDANTDLYIVTFPVSSTNGSVASSLLAPLREAATGAGAVLVESATPAPLPADAGAGEARVLAAAGRAALRALGARLPRDALVLVAPPHLDFNQDFLNRVRMNTISGVSWFLPLPFARHAVHAHPRYRTQRTHTGRFTAVAARADAAAFYMSDLDLAERSWTGPESAGVAEVLAGAEALRCIAAPDPAAVLPPRPRPAPAPAAAHDLAALDLGTRATLAQLLLETQHDADTA